MLFHLTQLARLTTFFPGQQVEQVADIRALQRKGEKTKYPAGADCSPDTLKALKDFFFFFAQGVQESLSPQEQGTSPETSAGDC